MFGALTFLLGLAAALVVALYVLAAVFRGIYHRDRSCDETHFITTGDGWRLALHRYVPKEPRADAPPVLIVHGLGGNSMNFDISPRQSLPRFIADEAGFECWTLDLRGSGDSTRPGTLTRFRFDYDFSAYRDRDLPAAIGYLTKRHGGPIHYAGHSMGGMLAYAFLPTPLGESIRSAVILASPARLEHFHFKATNVVQAVARLLPSAALATATEAAAPLFDVSPKLQAMLGFDPMNLYPGDAPAIAANNQNDFPIPLLIQFGTWAEADVSGDGRAAYKDDLEQIETPMLFVTGAGDQTAPVSSVRHGYERAGSKDKRFVLAGIETGFSFDYRHMDLVMGRKSREEIFPLVADWLAAH